MTIIKGYYEDGIFFDGNPDVLKNGMVLKGICRRIQEFMWTRFPEPILVAECLEVDHRQRFPVAVVNILSALEDALGDTCYTPIDYRPGFSHAVVVNTSGKWRWDILQRMHNGRRRNSMLVSFRTDSDMALALLKLKGSKEILDFPPRLLNHVAYIEHTFAFKYKCKANAVPSKNAEPLFSVGL